MQNITGKNAVANNTIEFKQNHSQDHHNGKGLHISSESEKKVSNNAQRATESTRQQVNKAILQANLQVNMKAGNEPMALLYKAAIEGINDVLKEELGSDAIQTGYDSGLDVSPEATAERIVTMSTAFFSQYKQQHPDMTDEQAAQSFTEIISSGIDQGFSEARNILDGLNVLGGEIADNIDTTYDLIQQGLQAFVKQYSQKEEK